MITKNKILYGVVVLVVILVITNPSEATFDKYIKGSHGKREWNFLIFSIYSNIYSGPILQSDNNFSPHLVSVNINERYIGVAQNFFRYK